MRVIKFNAWHIKQKKMYYADEMGADQLTLMPNNKGFVNVCGLSLKMSQVDNYQTMIPLQFVGVSDKNGKEYFDGDIVKTPDCCYPAEVVEREGEWILKWAEESVPLHNYFYFSEIIGNKHENPELLSMPIKRSNDD